MRQSARPNSRSIAILVVYVCIAAYVASQPAVAAGTPAGMNGSFINGVSCASAHFCVAVGGYVDSSGTLQPLTLVKRSTGWAIDNTAYPDIDIDYASASLQSVSCPTDLLCMAVGEYTGSDSSTHSWAARLTGAVWQAALLPPAGNDEFLADISCFSADFCVAVGEYVPNQTSSPLAYVFTDAVWSLVPVGPSDIIQPGNLTGIVCVSTDACVVSGNQLAATLDGGSWPVNGLYVGGNWSLQASLAPHYNGAYATDISCVNPRYCSLLGVGNQAGGGYVLQAREDTIELWSFEKELLDAAPSRWGALSCVDAAVCFAVGYEAASPGITGQSLVFHELSPGEWRLVTVSPNGSKYSVLTDISCSSQTACVAVGYYGVAGGQEYPLIVEYDGSQWHILDEADFIFDSSDNSLPHGFGHRNDPASRPAFVAFGDSITTGQSIAGCQPDRPVSPWGCIGRPATVPYPDRIAAALGYSYSSDYRFYQTWAPGFVPTDLNRVGIWGYTAQEAAQTYRNGRTHEGNWLPQLQAIEAATDLVVGGLGVNDIRFSDVLFWAKQYYRPGADHVTAAVNQLLQERSADLDQLFRSLRRAGQGGARVVVTLYYNPYDSPNRFCGDLENIGNLVVNALDHELAGRAYANGLRAADPRSVFRNHGSGTSDPYVFGTQCKTSSAVASWLPQWLGGGGGADALAIAFDPHPNNAGSQAIARTVLQELDR